METILQLFVGAAVFLVWYIHSKNRSGSEPAGAQWAAIGFGLLALLIAVVLELIFVPLNLEQAVLLSDGAMRRDALLIGLIEEAAKFIPLALFIYRKPYFNEFNDGLLYFALAGLAFGLPENILYTLSGGVSVGIIRLVMTPFFHAATTAIVGYFLISMKLKRSNVLGVVSALSAVITAHALYDYGLLRGTPASVGASLLVTFGLTTIMFCLIRAARIRDEEQGVLQKANQPVPVLQVPVPPAAEALVTAVPAAASVKPGGTDTAAVTAIVCGVSAVVLGIFPLFGIVLGLPAIILGVVARRHSAAMGTGAIVTGVIGMIGGVVWSLVWLAALRS